VIKAIQTQYKGCNFRSRLEARWAVFFDALGIKWEYEPEGFEFQNGLRYLPDFWLPEYKLWVEVKPQGKMSDTDSQKVLELVIAGDAPVYVTNGNPGDLGELQYRYTAMAGEINALSCPAVMDWSDARTPMRIWVPIQHSGDESDYSPAPFFFKESCLGMGEDYEDSKAYWSFCEQAVNAARSARFEHGECGATL
jgi:hypothetical protein